MKTAYVDHICDSVNVEHEAKVLMSDEDDVLEAGSFHVKQWISSRQTGENQGEVVFRGQNHVEKVLGTVWLPQEDLFTFKIKIGLAKENPPSEDPCSFVPTKVTRRLIPSKLPAYSIQLELEQPFSSNQKS